MLEFRVLGPLEVRRDGRIVEVRGSKRRAVLALLVLQANEIVRSDRLIEDLWGEQQPVNAPAALHSHVSRLRKDLGEDVVVTKPWGYVLRARPQTIDVRRFEHLVETARPLPAREREERLGTALSLWHGAALSDLAHEPALAAEAGRLDELRLSVVEQRIDAELELGQEAGAIPVLEGLIAEHPLRERLRGQLILALYRAGRQAEALETYRETRRVLVEELGIEPSPELRELERAILRQDPSLEPARPVPQPAPDDGDEPPASRWRWPRSPLVAGAAALLIVAGAGAAILATPRGGTPRAGAAGSSSSRVITVTSSATSDTGAGARKHATTSLIEQPRPPRQWNRARRRRGHAHKPPGPSNRTTTQGLGSTAVSNPAPPPPPGPPPPTPPAHRPPPPKPPPPPRITRIADDFEDGAISTETWFPSLSGTGTTMTEQNRRLEVSFAADAVAAPNNQGFSMMGAQVGTNCRFLGDFDVSVSYALVDWPESNGVLLQLAAWFRSGATAIGRQSLRTGPEFYTTFNGSSGSVVSGTLDRRGALRLRRVGSQLASYFRVRGRWVRLWSFKSSGAPTIGLQAMSTDEWFADRPVTVAFDDFEIKAAQPAC